MMPVSESNSYLEGCDLSSILRGGIRAALFVTLAALVNHAALAAVQVVELDWDAVDDVRVDHYELYYGPVTRIYTERLVTDQTQASVELPADGASYYFVVRACDAAAKNCSAFSNELPVTPSADGGAVASALMQPDPAADVTSEAAPLKVIVSDASQTGDSETGDGNVLQTLPIEIGEVLIDRTWQRVSFAHPFEDPILVAKGLEATDTTPAVVRVRGIDSSGFWIRAQEWGNSEGPDVPAKAGYMVMERGSYELPSGVLIEAGSVTASAANAFQPQLLEAGFSQAPVVFASVNSVNEADAVTSRILGVTAAGFLVGLWEQELTAWSHVAERVDYIAWEPSAGELDGLRYEVGRAPAMVDHNAAALSFRSWFPEPPVLVVDMESSNGWDTCDLRWKDLSWTGAQLWVEEEKSYDEETEHTGEWVGYFAADVSG